MSAAPEYDSVDELFIADLLRGVACEPERELDDLCQWLYDCGYSRSYVTLHLQAVTAAMMRGRGEL